MENCVKMGQAHHGEQGFVGKDGPAQRVFGVQGDQSSHCGG